MISVILLKVFCKDASDWHALIPLFIKNVMDKIVFPLRFDVAREGAGTESVAIKK